MYTAEYDSNDDDDDDDGFSFGDDLDQSLKNAKKSRIAANIEKIQNTQTSRGGFPLPAKPNASKSVFPVALTQNQTNVDDLRNAIIQGTLSDVQQLVDNGHSVNTQLRCGWTPLMYAANMAFIDKLTYLIEAGADVNYSKEQYSVLMAACACNKNRPDDIFMCVDKLLQAGAIVNSYDRYNTTPLMNAAREGHARVVSMLIEKGAEVNKQNNRGWTALSWAVSKGHQGVTSILLKVGAHKDIVHCDGQKALDVARNLGFTDIERLLGGKPDNKSSVSDANSTEQPPLLISTTKSTNQNKSFQMYSELELFLNGLTLSYLIPTFHKHNVPFEMLLTLTDEDLIAMDIDQVGARKKILDGLKSVHKKEWETSSLPQIDFSQFLKYEEVLAIVANISKHLKYIDSTMTYINKQVDKNVKIIEEAADGQGPKVLETKSIEAITHLNNLELGLNYLSRKSQQINKRGYFKSPDVITRLESSSNRVSYCLKWTGGALAIGTIYMFRMPIMSFSMDLVHKITRWCSV